MFAVRRTRNAGTAKSSSYSAGKAVLAGVSVVLAAGALSGCGALFPTVDQTEAGQSAAEPTTSSTESAADGGQVPAPSGSMSPTSTGVAPDPPPGLAEGVATEEPEWNVDAKSNAVGTALSAMEYYARSDVGAEEWHEDLEPYLSDKAKPAFARMQPQYLPVTEVKSATFIDIDYSNPYWVTVTMSTNDGDYLVKLNRIKAGEDWKVDQIQPKQVRR